MRKSTSGGETETPEGHGPGIGCGRERKLNVCLNKQASGHYRCLFLPWPLTAWRPQPNGGHGFPLNIYEEKV